MKLKLMQTTLALVLTSLMSFAQSADEIIANFFENTGGAEAWEALEGTKTKGTFKQQGMEIPVTEIKLKDGRSYTIYNFQGKEIVGQAFDGEVLWGHNFMSMEAEKKDDESTENFKREARDFPYSLFNYKDKGYQVELLGTETVEGAECFKLKLTKKPQLVDGQEVDNISYFYMDTENFVPIVVEQEIKSGEMKGKFIWVTFSDYQEVEGLYFPFAITQGIKDMGANAFTIQSIELNPTVDETIFAFPETSGEEQKDGDGN